MARKKPPDKAKKGDEIDTPKLPAGATPPQPNPQLPDNDVRRRFTEQQPDYEQLAKEVEFVLKKHLHQEKITVAGISSRAKTLDSFLDKLERKGYQDPFGQTTDFAGARVIYFFPDDLQRIRQIIDREFLVRHEENKPNKLAVDQFNYCDTQFLVQLRGNYSGARYDDLKDKVCEIQVRTVLQDAWAVFSHNLLYKKENQIPEPLRRPLFALAGVFETADNAFQNIKDRLHKYQVEINEKLKNSEDVRMLETDLSSLYEYLMYKFPNRKVEPAPGFLADLIDQDGMSKYQNLEQVKNLLDSTEHARRIFLELIAASGIPLPKAESVFELRNAMWLANPELYQHLPGNIPNLIKQANQESQPVRK